MPNWSRSSASVTRFSGHGKISPNNPSAAPVVVIHHHAAHAPAPRAARGHHLFRERDRQRADCLDGKAAREIALRIRLVKFFGQRVCRRRFVHAHQFVEPAEHDRSRLRH